SQHCLLPTLFRTASVPSETLLHGQIFILDQSALVSPSPSVDALKASWVSTRCHHTIRVPRLTSHLVPLLHCSAPLQNSHAQVAIQPNSLSQPSVRPRSTNGQVSVHLTFFILLVLTTHSHAALIPYGG